jgi:predicted nuclease of restriction endonuclease-like (RecB) superfamily
VNDKKPVFSTDSPLFDRIVAVIQSAQSTVVRSVNSAMVAVYWHIGREIVEEQQKGKERAEYGENLLEILSKKLTATVGKGFSATNLRNFRKFYLAFSTRSVIQHPAGTESISKKQHPAGADFAILANAEKVIDNVADMLTAIRTAPFSSDVSWSHYRALMRVENELARSFYEIETAKNHWSKDELERQITTQLFERLTQGKDLDTIYKMALTGETVRTPADAIRDPLILEFLNIPASHKLMETDLEAALITHLQAFLLELGSGFAFVGRQQRLTLDGDHFYADLVFYHINLKCYVVVDLKTVKLTHGDLGQMQLYVNYYDREVKDEKPHYWSGAVHRQE